MVTLRRAQRADLPAIVALLADDPLGARREHAPAGDDVHACYARAFADIDRDPAHELVVAECDGRVVGCLQLTVIPGLSRRGARRALIESVRVSRSMRGRGLGRQLFEWAIERAREAGCAIVQLTSDHRRPDAHRFYESLGFTATHAGFKLPLT